MDKLSELSKPVAWEVKGILCHSEEEARVYVGEPEPLYSQEYVSALLAELEASKQYAKERDAENESIALTVGRLRAKLATPVRLPELCGDGENDNEYTEGLNDGINQSAKAIRAAGFTFTVGNE